MASTDDDDIEGPWKYRKKWLDNGVSRGLGLDGASVLIVEAVVKCSPRIGFNRRKGPRLDDARAPELIARPSKGPAKAPRNQEFRHG